MTLERIIEACGIVSVKGCTSIDICSVCNDSRKVEKGSLFVAITGFATDGHAYISTALQNGAAAIIYDDQICRRL